MINIKNHYLNYITYTSKTISSILVSFSYNVGAESRIKYKLQ